MSELREEILGAGINKKRIIGVILVAVLLTSVFAFSTVFFSFLFNSQRPWPSEELDGQTYEEALLIKPPTPFDADFWQDLFEDYNITDLSPEMLELLTEILSEMMDGDIDNLDLGNFSEGLLPLLFGAAASEIEVFRVFNYLDFNNMTQVLWKYEAFDEYTGDGWESNAATDLHDFYSYVDYLSKYTPDPELLTIKMPLSPNSGSNSFTIPTLFPSPFIIEDTISAPNLITGTEQLYKDEFNSTTLDLSFSSDDDVNITFDMFGFYNHLPTPDELNNTAVEASYTPSYIADRYLQFPSQLNIYRSNNPHFNYHLSRLEEIIDTNDNAFAVADTIRKYLQTYFSFPQTQDAYNPVPEGRDVVDWFCETEQGVWSDFASAFCIFSRAFGIASRFVDGFNSYGIEEIPDDDLGQTGFAIKYKNLYNWAEIYIPNSTSGEGKWVQFDIFENAIISGDYDITVTTDDYSYVRPDTATIIATVSSDTAPIDGLTITFNDYTTDQTLGQDITDITGSASIQVDFDSTYTVGPHVIEARYGVSHRNYTYVEIEGDLSIVLTSVNPGVVNISDAQPDTTNVTGYVYDPLNNNTVEGPVLDIVLFENGTSTIVPNAFSPSTIDTTTNGIFTDFLNINYNDNGFFEVRADFNGNWVIDTPFGPVSSTTLTVSNSISNRIELTLTKDLVFFFYINATDSNDANYPLVFRYETLNLTARAFSFISGPYPNREVFFYDYSRGDVLLGSAITDINGYASINYIVGDYCKAGPNLLYARLGTQENYSYFILNEAPTINIISGPSPQVINRSGAGVTQFNIVGEIYDSTNNSLPISYSEITLIMQKGGDNYSSYLEPSETYPYQTDSSGTFDLTFGVLDNTPPGNYTLRLDFNGKIDLSAYPYSYQFNLPGLSSFTTFTNQLEIQAKASFLFWINGTTSDDYNNPRINRYEDLNLTAYIHTAGNYSDPIKDGETVEFYDGTQGIHIGSNTTINGSATVIYSTNISTSAGPHLIYAKWNNRENYSYFVLNDSISINLDPWPRPRVLDKYDPTEYFIIQGNLSDTKNNPIKYGEISIHLFNVGGGEIVNALRLLGGSYQSNQSGGIYAEVGIESFVPTGNFTLKAWFNGTFIYSSPNNINNEHDFNLPYINSSATTIDQLMVWDPNDIGVYLWIDGIPTLPTYYAGDGDYPEKYARGENITFTVYVRNSTFGPAKFGDIRLYDVFNNSNLLGNYSLDIGDSGQCNFILNTSSWHAGLHYIKVNWSSYSSFNTTYVIINNTFNLSPIMINPSYTILRNVDTFSVWGTLNDYGVNLRGLILNIELLDSTYTDVTSSYLIGTNSLRINNDGTFNFADLQISLLCPQGEYWLNVTFNGDIDDTGISQTNFMVHSNSSIQINITAGTYIIGEYDTVYYKDDFYYLDTLNVYGTLYWDNGSVIAGKEVDVTIQDQYGSNHTNTDLTDLSGFFTISFTIGFWGDESKATVWANFYPLLPDSYFIGYTHQKVFRAPP